jgi:hypothetical protein
MKDYLEQVIGKSRKTDMQRNDHQRQMVIGLAIDNAPLRTT